MCWGKPHGTLTSHGSEKTSLGDPELSLRGNRFSPQGSSGEGCTGNPQGPFHSANISAPALPGMGDCLWEAGADGAWPWEPEEACTPQQGGI